MRIKAFNRAGEKNSRPPLTKAVGSPRTMRIKTLAPSLWLSFAASLLAAPALHAQSQSAPAKPSAAPPASSPAAVTPNPAPATPKSASADPARAQSYYHAALAEIYEEQAIATGRP